MRTVVMLIMMLVRDVQPIRDSLPGPLLLGQPDIGELRKKLMTSSLEHRDIAIGAAQSDPKQKRLQSIQDFIISRIERQPARASSSCLRSRVF